MNQQHYDLQDVIDASKVSALQWRVILCCFLVVMADGFDTAAIGFIAPDIRQTWRLSAAALAPLFGAGLLGLTAGALLCGPLSDRLGRKKVIAACVLFFGLMSLLSAFAPDMTWLIILRFLTGLGLGGAMPNTITMTSEYLPVRRRGALVTLMFCGFTVGSALGGVSSAWLVPHIGWTGILILGGVLPLALGLGLILWMPESPRWLARRAQSQPQVAAIISKITGRHEHRAAVFTLAEGEARTSHGTIASLFTGKRLAITLLLWGIFFMSLLIIYLLSSWLPTLLNQRGVALQQASWVTAAFQVGGTLGAVGLGWLMDRRNPYTTLAISYLLGALCIVAIGYGDGRLSIMALAIFGTGIGISGSQVGLNALCATLYPTDCRATGVSWANAAGRCGAIVGSLSGGLIMALTPPFSTLFLIIAVPALLSTLLLILLAVAVRINVAGKPQAWPVDRGATLE